MRICQRRRSNGQGLLVVLLLLQSSTINDAKNIAKKQGSALASLPETPEFVVEHSGNTTATVGDTAILSCRVRHIGSRQVSWGRGIEVLTGGMMVFADVKRFKPLHDKLRQDWILKIRRVVKEDQGWYFCQVGTAPPISHNVYLTVVVPRVRILGAPEMFINRGSQTNLTCVVESAVHLKRPTIRWNHNEKLAEFDMSRRGVSVVTTHAPRLSISSLLIRSTEQSDAGTYLCETDSVPAGEIMVVVVNGDAPAAMQTGAQSTTQYCRMFLVVTFLVTAMNRHMPSSHLC